MNRDAATPLRILIVEDDAVDRELVETGLMRGGMKVDVDAVETLDQVRSLLDAKTYDLVLADYRLKGWRGMDLVPEINRRGLDLPLILVTGTVGEVLAVQCLRDGATDCVFKHNLDRLPLAARRAIEERLARLEHAKTVEHAHRLSVAVDQSPAAVFITDTMGRIEYVNQRFSEITGYSAEEAIGQNPRILRSGKTPPAAYEALWGAISRGRAWHSEILNRRKNGELYWSAVSVSPVKDADGGVTHFVAIHEDVSERRWADEMIREREERFRQIADNINEVFFVVAADFHETLYISPAYEGVWGRSCRSLYENPSSFMDAIHPEDRGVVIGQITRTRAGERADPVEFRVVRPNGEERWVRTRAAPVLNEQGEVYRISGVALDITERRHMEDRLRGSEDRFRKLVEASFDIIVQSVEGILQEVSSGWTRTLGYSAEDTIGRPILDFIAAESRDDVRRRVTEQVEGRYDLTLLHKTGRPILFEATGKLVEVDGKPGRITALRDLTASRALEGQLRQAQKLEAVARLAGGVAHDFNNLLTVILTEIELLKIAEAASATPALTEALGEMEEAARRAAALTRQLLTFSRHDVVTPRVLDPVEIVEGLKKMLGRLIGEDIHVEMLHDRDTGHVRVDRGQFEQVIVNLALNARDAMPQGGRLQIEVADVVIDESYAEIHPESVPGPHVLISVSDTGIGMSEEVRQRMFEPFFTTKPSGQGTGLGLATSYGIVREAGGHIGVYTEVGVGTTMKVYLPLVTEEGEGASEAEKVVSRFGPLAATVLVVEDEAAVRRSAVRSLERIGCTVIAAASGAEGLESIQKADRSIDLIFTDIVMPGLSGPEFVAQARKLLPQVKVLFTTGYTSDMAFRLKLLEDGVAVSL